MILKDSISVRKRWSLGGVLAVTSYDVTDKLDKIYVGQARMR